MEREFWNPLTRERSLHEHYPIRTWAAGFESKVRRAIQEDKKGQEAK
jgi:hypothetical protein